jgi:XTP/dITP diphosphohydrolase
VVILWVATKNAGKLRDFAWSAEGCALRGERVEIRPMEGLKGLAAPEEDGETFEANARLKAAYYSRFAQSAHSRRAAGEWVLADDSGLEVDALGGRPGVRSARFAEDVFAGELGFAIDRAAALSGVEGDTDSRNNATLLRLMERVPQEARTARYRCVLALAREGKVVTTAEGMVEGRILFAERGAGGFGYDPLFLLPELGLTMAEVDPVTRLGVSHRGRALRALLAGLEASDVRVS